MNSIPKVQTDSRELNQAQDNILAGIKRLQIQVDAQILPFNGGIMLKNINLSTGINTISTKLGRILIGWYLIRKRATADIWDSQDSNASPQTTLVLNASAPVNVDIFCF